MSAANDEAGRPEITKAEAVRLAILAGILSPVEGAKWIRQTHCLEVSPVYFSVIKSRMGLKAPEFAPLSEEDRQRFLDGMKRAQERRRKLRKPSE